MDSINYKYRIKQIYSPPFSSLITSRIKKIFNFDKMRFYSYGRYALYHGLISMGLINGDKILVPSLICRDLLASLNKSGICPIYYDVDKNLKPILNSQNFEKIKAILIINYFGFSQDLKLIKKYCQKSGCILIEDNAHGFLSCDPNGEYLGTRGDLGIFSIRKTIPLLHGGALYIKDETKLVTLPEQLDYYNYPSSYYNIKEIIRKLIPVIGIKGILLLSQLLRILRRIRTGHYIPVSDFKDEIELPLDIQPSINLLDKINKLNIDEEIIRRCEMYNWLNKIMAKFEVTPVFSELPNNCVPYTFPFYCSDKKVNLIKNELYKYNLEIFNWPALPEKLKNSAPMFYTNIWCVRFLW